MNEGYSGGGLSTSGCLFPNKDPMSINYLGSTVLAIAHIGLRV